MQDVEPAAPLKKREKPTKGLPRLGEIGRYRLLADEIGDLSRFADWHEINAEDVAACRALRAQAIERLSELPPMKLIADAMNSAYDALEEEKGSKSTVAEIIKITSDLLPVPRGLDKASFVAGLIMVAEEYPAAILAATCGRAVRLLRELPLISDLPRLVIEERHRATASYRMLSRVFDLRCDAVSVLDTLGDDAILRSFGEEPFDMSGWE
jgi:hypothetical protein